MTGCGWVTKLFFHRWNLVYSKSLSILQKIKKKLSIAKKYFLNIIRSDDHRIPLSVTFNQQPSGESKTSFDNPANCLISWLWKAQSAIIVISQMSEWQFPWSQKGNFKTPNTKVINFQMLRTSVLTFSRFTGTIPSLGRFAFRQASLFRFGQ